MKRFTLALLVASLAGSALLVGTARASALSACGSKVIADWYDNGRIDRTYPIPCYREALRNLPLDVQEYADAEVVINRAMALAIRSKTTPRVGNTGDTDTTQTDTTQTGTNQTVPPATGGGDGNPPGAASSHPDPLLTKAIKRLGPSSANSIPLPLVVLGALALLLLAAGAAGMVARKLQERRLPATPAGTPPPDVPQAS